ncbi:MAG TPA: hypothetical protein VLF89_00675 [Candidatus Saccharimonadales bacterium]|nr:hypothetical protein [Candidatus Saccharimonadales bacterium]
MSPDRFTYYNQEPQRELPDSLQFLVREVDIALGGAEFVYPKVDALFAFSGMSIEKEFNIPWRHFSLENFSVVQYAVEIGMKITADQMGKQFETITQNDILALGPVLYVHGGRKQVDAMASMAEGSGYPPDKIISIGCDKCDQGRQFANTKTQFNSLKHSKRYRDVVTMQSIALIARPIHTPRLLRTADFELPPHIKLTAFCPKEPNLNQEKYESLKNEMITKMLEYSNYPNPPEYYLKQFGRWPREHADISFIPRGWYGGYIDPPETEDMTIITRQRTIF